MDKRSALRVADDGSWCEVTVELKDGRLSICGSAGESATPHQARKMALDNWISYFEESPAEIVSLNERCGCNFRSARSCARYVIENDGEYHGLDVYAERDGKILLLHSCGQIRDEIATWFPEVAPYFRWHLNDMHSECEHQEARGESYKTHPDAVCPDCGYKCGSAWTKRKLPRSVVKWARTFGEGSGS